jgi:hypothetical protein
MVIHRRAEKEGKLGEIIQVMGVECREVGKAVLLVENTF